MSKNGKGIRHVTDDIYQIDYQVDGIRKQHRIRTNSLKNARKIRDEHIVDLRRKSPISHDKEERLHAGFDEAWEKLYNDLISDGVSRKNLLRHKRIFWRLFDEFRKPRFPRIDSVNKATLPFLLEYKSYYMNELGLNPKGGWRAELVCIKSMIRRLRKLGYCGKEILEDMATMKMPKQEKKYYPDIPKAQLNQILNRIKEERPDYYNILYYICRTGRRIEETTLIERRDVEWIGLKPVKINIRAETTKMRAPTQLKLLDEELERLIKTAYGMGSRHKTVYLFCNRRGKKCSQGRVRDHLKKVSKEIAGIAITMHYFRHRFLTECGKSNVSMSDAMAIAGIKGVNTVLNYYSHNTDDGLRKVLDNTRI